MSLDHAPAAESWVLAALKSTSDVSAGSPELAALVDGWESAYHFSPTRAAVLAPLRLRPGQRAVEFGCGSGVLIRALAEAGLDVVGVEPDSGAADAARERCRDMPSVRIVASPDDELARAGGFQVVLLTRPEHYLAQAAAALAEDGVMVLAVENRLSLTSLLGAPGGDERCSWSSLVGSPEPTAWTHGELADKLAESGLHIGRTLFPYPDQVGPRIILDESVFDRGDAEDLVDKLVRDPFRGTFGDADVPLPGRAIHRMVVREGSGRALAPAFLVLAGRRQADVAAAADPALGWLINSTRLPAWRRIRLLDTSSTVRTTVRGGKSEHPWLRQRAEESEPFLDGPALDAELLDRLAAHDIEQATALLGLWRSECLREARELRPDDLRHPFLPGKSGVAVLPPDHLDIHPGNIIVNPGAGLVRIDREWEAGDGVDAELVSLRALLEFARDVVVGNAPHPWPGASEIGVLTELAALVDLDEALRERWPELVLAEAAFQEAVTGTPSSVVAESIETAAHRPAGEAAWSITGGLPALRAKEADHAKLVRDLAEATTWFEQRERALEHELGIQKSQVAELTSRLNRVEHGLSMAKAELAVKDDRIGLAFGELTAAVAEAAVAWQANEAAESALASARERVGQLETTVVRLEALERSKIVRVAKRALWPAARSTRGFRDLLTARPGEEPDGLLRQVARRSPALAARVSGRYRAAAADYRDQGLHFDLPLPAEPVAVGGGQIVELAGWVAHSAVPVSHVGVLAGSRRIVAERGHYRPDVVESLRHKGVRVPAGCGITVRVPISRDECTSPIPVTLVVRLVDGSVLRRDLGALTLAPSVVAPIEARWPGDGMKVAICLASYQPKPEFLARQLESLVTQSHENWVCVISDDGSDRASLDTINDLAAGDERFIVLPHGENVGFYKNFERAIAAAPADADAIALCDQDDVWDADKLSVLVEQLSDPKVSLAYSDMRLIDDEGATIGETFWRNRRNQWTHIDSLLMLNTMTGASMLVRADVMRDQVLPFPPGTPSAFHDQWIGVAALACGEVRYVDRPLYSYRQHGANVTGLRDSRLDHGMPGILGLVRLAVSGDCRLPLETQAELEAVAEFELARIAQFATVALMRTPEQGDERTAQALRRLAAADRDTWALLRAVAKTALRRAGTTAGAEHRLLTAGLRKRGMRTERLTAPLVLSD